MNMNHALLALLLLGCDGKDEGIDNPEYTDDTETTETTPVSDPDMAGDTIEDAASTEALDDLEWGDVIAEGAIDEAGDRDFYAIQVEQGYDYLIAAAAYIYNYEGVPDTVLRLYNEDGEFLAENDDMPFRFWETDSALWFQAEYDGTYYVEVLEFSDWSESSEAEGGSNYEYELWGVKTYYSEGSSYGENDTQEDADALYEYVLKDGDAGLYYSSWFDGYLDDSFAQYISNIYGHISYDGDVDVWRFDLDYSKDDYDWGWMTWTAFDITDPDFVPRFSLYNADWEQVATTTDVGYTGNYYATYDTDLAYPVTSGTWYLVVENDVKWGTYGPLYAINRLTWLGSIADQETESSDLVGLGDTLTMTESTNTAGYYYGRGTGMIDTDDERDSYRIDAGDVGGSLGGMYLSVELQAEGIGSFLDAKVVIYDEDTKTVLTEASVNPSNNEVDPHVLDLEISGDPTQVFVSVEPESQGEVGASNHYIFIAYLYSEPVN